MQPDELAASVVLIVKSTLTPLLERLAVAEARLASLDGVRDRVVTIETKQAMPAPVDPAIADMRQLVTRFAESTPAPDAELSARVKVLEDRPEQLRVDELTKQITDVHRWMEAKLEKELVTVRERVAAIETRAAVPGPIGLAGKDGADGRDGVNGKDGAPGRDGRDGIALDDLSVTQEHERTFVIRAQVGGQIKDIGSVTVPVDIYRGVWVDGKTYDHGDNVTLAGSAWHCNQTTTQRPGEGSKDWTLKVKRGADGKDYREPGANALPIVRTR